MVAPDDDLFVLGVAVEPHDLHAVEQRAGDCLGHVCRRDEHDVGQVELDLEVVVAERVVLRRVEHFEQGRSGIARPTASGQLVDLVEQHDRVHGSRLGDRSHEPSRLCADVRAAVAADLGLVAYAAQRDTNEATAHCARDRLAERRLADARRADEGDDRAGASARGALPPRRLVSDGHASLGAQLAHAEILDDAVLHLVETRVIGVEDGARFGHVELVFGDLAPRELEHAVEPGADPALLGALPVAALEPIDLAVDLRAHLLRQRQLGGLGAVVVGRLVVTVAELLADGGHLLAQQEVTLRLVHPLGNVVADALGHHQLGQRLAGPLEHELQPFVDVDCLEDPDLRIDVLIGPRRHRVGQRSGVEHRAEDLGQPA